MNASLQDRFRGCLIGLAVGDALGGRFEAQPAAHIRQRFPTEHDLLAYVTDEIWYTDDTQMTIAVAETLIEHGQIFEDRLCDAFVANYVPSRGYGRGARRVIEAMEDGKDHRDVAANHFPGGSYGNGAAMRVAPIGLLFHEDAQATLDQSRLSALPTHVHPHGIEGAQLLAIAVAYAARETTFDYDNYFQHLITACHSPEFRRKLTLASGLKQNGALETLGNGIQALESVATSIAAFSLSPNSYLTTVSNAIFLGGDTDTLAAMAGAISGAYLGLTGVPTELTKQLENTPKGRDYIVDLADRLYSVHQNGNATIDT